MASQDLGVDDVIKPIKVSTAIAITRQVKFSINATGAFIADEVSDIASETEGRVIATPVDIGDFVRKGEVIARIDDRAATLRLQQAIAAERQAEASHDQAKARLGQEKDVNDEAGSQTATPGGQAGAALKQDPASIDETRRQGVTAALAGLEVARAQTALARKALSDTIVKAPFTGHISDRPTAPGEHITPSVKIATIQRINPIKLRLQIPEADAGLARVSAMVTATVAAYPQRKFNGRVTAINPVVDPASRTISVEVRIENPEHTLRPGMFATAEVRRPGDEEGVFIPSHAVIKDQTTNSSHVFVLQGDVVRMRVVQTEGQTISMEDGMVRIRSGLSDAETVIISNLSQLFEGAKVVFR